MILTGAEDRYNVTMSIQSAPSGTGYSKVALYGEHWKMLRKVRTRPATLIRAIVMQLTQRKIFSLPVNVK